MKTIKQLSLIAVMAVLFTSCVTSWFSSLSKNSQNIEPGMSKQEVIAILGKSSYRSFHDRYEQWEYRSHLGADDWDVVRIDFKDGRVVGMDSFREIHPQFPESPKCTK